MGMTYYELFQEYEHTFYGLAPTMIVFARFICTSILHLSLIDEVTVGMEMMKFAINHQYKFVLYFMAWLNGFLQVTAMIMIETASIGVICSAEDVLDIIFNFIALSIVAEFDNYVFYSLKNESFC